MKTFFVDKHALVSKEELRIIEKFVPTNGLVFDIGATLGQWTIEVLKMKKGRQYHLFEPSSVSYAKLAFNR